MLNADPEDEEYVPDDKTDRSCTSSDSEPEAKRSRTEHLESEVPETQQRCGGFSGDERGTEYSSNASETESFAGKEINAEVVIGINPNNSDGPRQNLSIQFLKWALLLESGLSSQSCS
ncbi:MAG: hypothetical protein NXY57DRAFT_1043270 [Lentinula lateritia]|nr:MAG: hypothetical protein NXY57DRAFT_1043270 [Lentinula lateritia]